MTNAPVPPLSIIPPAPVPASPAMSPNLSLASPLTLLPASAKNLVPANLSIPSPSNPNPQQTTFPNVPPATPIPAAAPITPAAVPPATPVKTVGSALTTATTAPPVVPPPQTASPAQNALGSTLAAFGAGLQQLSDTLGKQATNPDGTPTDGTQTPSTGTSLSDVLKNFLALNTKLGTKTDETNKINAEQGIDAKSQQVADLTAQYSSRSKYYDDLIQKAQTQNPNGKSADAIQQDVDELTRQKQSELADIAIQQSAASGNLKVASDIATRKIDAEFEPVQAQLDNLKAYYSLASNDLTDSEQLAAQAEITKKQSILDEAKTKRLADYNELIKQNDPLTQAQVAHEQALTQNVGADSGTAAERSAAAIANFSTAFSLKTDGKAHLVPGTDVPTIDSDGKITPEAWKAAISSAPAEGLTREDFIKAFGSQISTPDGKVSTKYGLSPKEIELITGDSSAVTT